MERSQRFALSPPVDDASERCELAKGAYNAANRGKSAYQVLTLVFAVALVVALLYAIITFRDEESARGFLALVAAVGFGGGGAFLFTLREQAAEDANAMWERVEKYCD